MANRSQKPRRPSPLMRLVKALYLILVILSAIIVALFLAYKLLIRAPSVDNQVTFPVQSAQPGVSQPPDDPGESGEPAQPSEEVIVYTRREGVYTCVLTGCDEGSLRADTIMLGCFDTVNGTASLVSIPRDTLVYYNNKNTKINTVYSHGGGKAMAQEVSELLGVPVDYYVAVDLDAFGAIVKAIGGVYFDVPIDMDYDDPYQDLHIHLQKGYQKLDADGAIGVVRFRHNNDGTGYVRQDYERVETQRKFLTALVSQTITVSNAAKVTDLISILQKYVDTDMPLDTMIYFATQAIGMDLGAALETATLPSEWKSPYVEVDDDKALELVNRLLPVYTQPITAGIMDIRHR